MRNDKLYELLTLMALPTDVKTWFALLPSVVIAAMQTTIIKASITAYSTAVGPSSFLRKELSHALKLHIRNFSSWRTGTSMRGYRELRPRTIGRELAAGKLRPP